MNEFVTNEWNSFCERVERSAAYLAGGDQNLDAEFKLEAARIKSAEVPGAYAEFLKRVKEVVDIVIKWQDKSPVIERDFSRATAEAQQAS